MPPRAKRGVLPVIAALFIMSAVVRLVGDAAPVLAQERTDPAAETAQAPTQDLAGEEMSPALIEALRDREARLADREERLADRMRALAVAEAEISEKLDALKEAEDSLAAMLALASTAAEDDLGRLTQVYENMKPQEAAALFETMEPAFSAGFMGRMQPEAAAAIMSNLDPQTAYLISVVLAGRNANAPRE
jgi:flagellar motility protein MotE (MotC chaperone)